VGSQAVMEPARRMFVSSSYWSDNVGLVAALTTIRELKRRDSVRQFREIGEALRNALNGAIADAGLQGSWTGLHTGPALSLTLPDPSLRGKVNTLFVQEMARRGVHCLTSLRATLAHGEAEIQQTALAATEALAVIKHGLDSGDLDNLLLCDTKKEPFRRLVR
jgi:glutamate-1-semialdehyde 2,1-aminomutase